MELNLIFQDLCHDSYKTLNRNSVLLSVIFSRVEFYFKLFVIDGLLGVAHKYIIRVKF